MGSSVRKVTEKIKKLLNNALIENPDLEYSEVVPKLAKEVVESKIAKDYLKNKEFATLIGGGLSCFKKAQKVGLEQFLQVNGEEETSEIEIQKFITSILETLEEENGAFESTLILAAFQSAMTKMIMQKITQPKRFLMLFCEIFIKMIVREGLNENIIEKFEVEPNEVEDAFEVFAANYVNEKFEHHVDKLLNEEINIDEFIKMLNDEISR